jgi:hypothetical protein
LLMPLALHSERLAASPEGKFDILMIQLFLARAEYGLGNVQGAGALIATARQTAKPILSLPEARMVIARFDRELRLGVVPQ